MTQPPGTLKPGSSNFPFGLSARAAVSGMTGDTIKILGRRSQRTSWFSRPIIFLAAAAGIVLQGCGPDAPHDNPLDPANQGSGVYGTIYRAAGGVIAGAVVTARPANIVATSDGQGAYSISLEPGRYFLEAACSGYKTEVDTVEVAAGIRQRHNFLLSGLASFDSAGVRTKVTRSYDGLTGYQILPWCAAYHPDGADFLDDYTYICRLDTFVFLPDSSVPQDGQRRKYFWGIASVPGVANFPQWVTGRRVEIVASSPNHSLLIQRAVPGFLEPLPYNLQPNNYQTFSLPDTLRWENGLTNVNLTLEIYSGLNLVWRQEIPFSNRFYCEAALTQPGIYVWRVVMKDNYGNTGSSEATFTQP